MSKSPNLFNFLISFKTLRLSFHRRELFFFTYLHRHLLVLATVIGNHRCQCSFLVIPVSLSFSFPSIYNQLSLSFSSVYNQLSLSFPSVYSQHVWFHVLPVFQLLSSSYGSPLFLARSSFYLDLLVFLVFLVPLACISILSTSIFSGVSRPTLQLLQSTDSSCLFRHRIAALVAHVLLCIGLFFFHWCCLLLFV